MSHGEDRLVEALRAGDAQAFTEFFNTYADKIFRLSAGILHDDDEAEDVVQESFLRVITRLDGFEGKARLNVWLYRVAYNESISRLRRRKPRAVSLRIDDIESGDSPLPTPMALSKWRITPEEILADAEARSELEAAIGELPELLRVVFILRDIEGLSTAETAEALELGQQAVKVRLHRARLLLRERLTSYFGGRYGGNLTMDCEQLLKYLSAYIDQELDDEVVLMAQKHLATCPNCRVVLDTTKKTISLYQRSVPRTISSECCQHLFEMLNVLFQRRKIAESHGEGTL